MTGIAPTVLTARPGAGTAVGRGRCQHPRRAACPRRPKRMPRVRVRRRRDPVFVCAVGDDGRSHRVSADRSHGRAPVSDPVTGAGGSNTSPRVTGPPRHRGRMPSRGATVRAAGQVDAGRPRLEREPHRRRVRPTGESLADRPGIRPTPLPRPPGRPGPRQVRGGSARHRHAGARRRAVRAKGRASSVLLALFSLAADARKAQLKASGPPAPVRPGPGRGTSAPAPAEVPGADVRDRRAVTQ